MSPECEIKIIDGLIFSFALLVTLAWIDQLSEWIATWIR